ncbi:MAG: hypothetical protein JNL71_08610 [Rhodospirillales bacterium]|nr:hypothetical protein [Rhodospirillales bacterium]
MSCPRTCLSDQSATGKSACDTSCSKVERMLHNILRPNAVSAGLIDAQIHMLAALGSPSMPRL